MPQTLEIMIKCPTTGEAVGTGNFSDANSLKFVSMENMPLPNCPACGASHRWSSADTFLNG